jgi:hypothetical protein
MLKKAYRKKSLKIISYWIGYTTLSLKSTDFVYNGFYKWYTTNWKVAGSIPDSVIGIFYWQNPYGRTMALGSIQSITEMSTGNIPGG